MARKPEALKLLSDAVETARRLDTTGRSWTAMAQSDYGTALALSGRFDEADRLLQETLPIARKSALEGTLASTWNAIGLTRQLQLQWAGSEPAFHEALKSTDDRDQNVKHRTDAFLGIAVARLELGQGADAEKWLHQADEQQLKLFVAMSPLRADIAMNLGRALLAQGKIEAANESFAAANAYWLGYDATNRCAGVAAYWKAQGHNAAGAKEEARADLTRAIGILKSSPLPGDVRLTNDARLMVAKL
jgi:tetratricopeptide (TPR) repeat protein